MRKFKIVISVFLALGLLATGIPMFNITAVANALNSDELLLITDSNTTNESEEVKVDEIIQKVKIKLMKPKEIDNKDNALTKGNYKNICVDGNIIENDNIKNELTKHYNNGKRIIIKSKEKSLKEICGYFGVSEDIKNKLIELPEQKSENLRVVGISIEKGSNNCVNTTIIRAEEFDNEKEVSSAI